MSIRRALALSIWVLLFAAGGLARPIQIPRQPDFHNGKIVFSYVGSLWVVNEDGSNPHRLTVNTAHDAFPRFSPDGKWIAFASDRYGNDDVFVIPAEGGEARQLTFNTAHDTVVGWSRDSRKVIFASARGLNYPGIPNLYEVPVEGGLETPIPTDWGTWGSFSPDGSKFVFNRHPMVWWRKHYRGSYAADLWVMDVAKKTYRKLLDADTPDNRKPNNFWPMYGNGAIYFVSDRDVTATAGAREVYRSANNIWKIPEDGGVPVQVTHFKDGSLFFPSMSSDGKVIVFEENFGLWKLDARTGKASEVKISIAADDKENNFQVLTVRGETDDYNLSPSSQRAAISAHGEIFTIATDRGDVTRVTSSYRRDTQPVWSPDGKWIAYVSDESGQPEIWVATPQGKNARKLTASDSEKLDLTWFPDSKSLVYTASDHKLYVLDVESGQARVLATNDASSIFRPSVSPDGAWVAYAKLDRDLRSHVWIVSVQNSKEHRLPDDQLFSTLAPRWTPDGKTLIFLGGYVQGGSATRRENVAALYGVSLTTEDENPMSRDVDSEEEARSSERDGRERAFGRSAGAPRGPVEVKIDFTDLERRIHRITRLSDNVTTAVPAPDSHSYAFVTVGESDGRRVSAVYTVQADGTRLRRVTQSLPPRGGGGGGFGGFGGGISSLQYSRDGRTIYFLERNNIWAASLGGPTGGERSAATGLRGGSAAGAGGRRRVNFTVRVEVDNRAERKQVFEEAWRTMKYRFYDAQMNGVDWAHMRTIYEALLPDVGDREDLQNVVSQMIGELNASHTGIRGGGERDPDRIQTRYPGFELSPDASDYYKVTTVYKDGPADKDYVKLSAGDFILAVGGRSLRSGENYWKLYNLAPGRKLEFTVNSKPQLEGAWTVKVEPVSALAHSTLQHEKWVEDRRRMVEKLSGGEIGYLHIRQMNGPSLRKFERDLADNHFKKALIIDQRFNPGGGIDQELLEILQQRQYQYTRGRGSVFITRPQRAFFGPIVVMQNERSTSDAEVFPDGIRTLKLGTTVGVTTYGAVIGTGAYRLMDGSTVRTPGTGLWNVGGQNLENYGVPPDVWVDNTPADFLAGRDAQLEKAVEVLKEELRKHPPEGIPGR